jgi:hypothetical protein
MEQGQATVEPLKIYSVRPGEIWSLTLIGPKGKVKHLCLTIENTGYFGDDLESFTNPTVHRSRRNFFGVSCRTESNEKAVVSYLTFQLFRRLEGQQLTHKIQSLQKAAGHLIYGRRYVKVKLNQLTPSGTVELGLISERMQPFATEEEPLVSKQVKEKKKPTTPKRPKQEEKLSPLKVGEQILTLEQTKRMQPGEVWQRPDGTEFKIVLVKGDDITVSIFKSKRTSIVLPWESKDVMGSKKLSDPL